MKVAIVCDWLTGIGGAERVVMELHKAFPEAPIYTSQYDEHGGWFKDADVRTLWLQKLPWSLRKFLPVLRAWSFSRLDLSGYDVVISASGAEAKAIRTGKNTLHVNYCFAPTHYYWSRYEEYIRHPGFGAFDWLARLGLRLLLFPMRRWDYKAAQRADVVVAISQHIKAEIKKYYGRDAVVIHPPVDTSRFKQSPGAKRHGFLAAGRQTPYKRFDVAIEACSGLGLPLTIAGNGPDNKRLRSLAGPTVTFIDDVSDEQMTSLIQSAEAFIFPGLDDFGIIPVEAMAAGTPVIAFRAGGALDYVIEGKTGLFFSKPSASALAETLKKFKPEDFDHEVIAKFAEQFSTTRFESEVKEFLKKKVAEGSS